MAHIPEAVRSQPIAGLKHLNSGKVRDTYELRGDPDKLLVVASDRISIFDFVLAAFVACKGEVLTAMNIFWRVKIFKELFPHDLIAYGAGIDEFLPEGLRGNAALQKRAVVVEKLTMLKFEAIVRGYLTGSGLGDYNATAPDHRVGGHRLPAGLQDGSVLPCPIFTPSTKATLGHDINIEADAVAKEHGVHPERMALQAYVVGVEYTRTRGIILADTKFEFGLSLGLNSKRRGDYPISIAPGPKSGVLCIADEVFTPDSSRFWRLAQWEEALKKGTTPQSHDKEFVRNWGKEIGIKKRKPENPDDVEWVHQQVIPADVLATTTRLYRYIFWRLTGKKLEKFQRDEMGIPVELPRRKIDILIGSSSDARQIGFGPLGYIYDAADVTLNVISCHRNPDVLQVYAQDCKADVVIAGAGMSAQLPGVTKGWLDHYGKNIPVIGVAFHGADEGADLAARSAIECLPGTPVELDKNEKAYFGINGFVAACVAAVEHEFMPRSNTRKEVQLGLNLEAAMALVNPES